MIKKIKDFFKVGRVCGGCTHYKRCYKHSVGYLERNTLEQPSCKYFEEAK